MRALGIFVSTGVILWCVGALIALVVGVDAQSGTFSQLECHKTRFNRVMTYTGMKYVYKAGCWLGEDVR